MSIFNRKVKRVERFEECTFDSESEKRNAEEKILAPPELEHYTGPIPKHKSELESRTALIVFKDKAQMDLVGTLFSIRESSMGVTYITDISLLETIAKNVRDGHMKVVKGAVTLVENSKRRSL